jgi:hypothetical protein
LLDFGLAMLADDDASVVIAGTARYLPPEAFGGAIPSPAFDLWALATVLREITAGDRATALDAFFAQALAPDVNERFQTALAFEAALTALASTPHSIT